jgi:hypothetical protein
MMLTAKQLLATQVAGAFRGRPDMPLMAALDRITQAEASWQPDANTPSIEQLVRHIAWSKSRFCQQGFGTPMPLDDPTVDEAGDSAGLSPEFPCGATWGRSTAPGIEAALQLLEKAQRIFAACLESCSEEMLEKPIPAPHGRSATNFFWTMLMHDIYHAGQIRTRRTFYHIQQNANP